MSEKLLVLNLRNDPDYHARLSELKHKFRTAQVKAIVKVNQELLKFYWELGEFITQQQLQSKWGAGLIKQLSHDLMAEFPDIKGFSVSNLKYIKQWVVFYSQTPSIGQQLVGQITQIPWGHNIAIISKCKTLQEALYYVQQTISNNWSRSVLVHQIEGVLHLREGKSITNFLQTLPKPQSDLAGQTLKDPFLFDFLTLRSDYNERELENALIDNLSQLLLELGTGFAYIGKQVNVQVGANDYYLDLLFYHTVLHSYFIIELKTVPFEPEFAGKLNFYIKAVDAKYRRPGDEPTIGLLICKSKDKLVVEYSLSDINKPIGVSEYHLSRVLPDNLKSSLPSIEDLEHELSGLANLTLND